MTDKGISVTDNGISVTDNGISVTDNGFSVTNKGFSVAVQTLRDCGTTSNREYLDGSCYYPNRLAASA